MKVGVARETAPGERRVALVPEALAKLTAAKLDVLVEAGAGAGALIPDEAYAEAGAKIVKRDALYAQSDVILKVQKPSESEVRRLRKGQTIVAFLQPLIDPKLAATLAKRGVTAISLDAIPRTLSRAQTMDALSSQANVGGYKAVLIAANAFGRYFPLLTTAAGTARPANVLILGIGVAGLQAIGTARRLGAVVRAYDVRPETKEQAESLGAQFLVLKSVADAAGEGGYARQLTKDEQAAQQQELNGHIAGMDIVITTAQVPGRRPPLLVTKAAVLAMKPGSVIVDMAASSLGGNVELSKPGQTIVTKNGVTIIAPDNLPATMPVGASAFYARNISSLLLGMVTDGRLNLDFSDEVTAGTVISHAGKVVQPATLKLLEPAPKAAPAQRPAKAEPTQRAAKAAPAPRAAKAEPTPRAAKAPARPAAKAAPAAKLAPVAATAGPAAAPAAAPPAPAAAKPPRPANLRPATPKPIVAQAAAPAEARPEAPRPVASSAPASPPTRPGPVPLTPMAGPKATAAATPIAGPTPVSAPKPTAAPASAPRPAAPPASPSPSPAARPAPLPTTPTPPSARSSLTPSVRPAPPPSAGLAPVVPSVVSVAGSTPPAPSGGPLKPRPWVKARERAAAKPPPAEPGPPPAAPSDPETGGQE
ncbi:MAG: Re/Si-specific NAD(P)(+) transhydrogenase subunit alpha [Chloroflexota bacterium]|nr:Re/Si-specific NAD(P)(+) transhydrogenase subunit alpha [Chloroflexota bacterium]